LGKTRLSLQRGPGWAIVRLSTGDGLNKLGSTILEELTAVVEECVDDPALSCLAIKGEGGSFAVGADLREVLSLTSLSARTFSDLGNRLFRVLERTDAAIVACIDGFCLGGGLDLALAADWRIATERSMIGHPGADLGLITGFGGTQRLARLIGPRKTLEMLMSGRRVTASEAYQAGLVQEICSLEDFEEKVMSRVEQFRKMSREIIGAVKVRLVDLPVVGNAPGVDCG